jgi:hypothetical protein
VCIPKYGFELKRHIQDSEKTSASFLVAIFLVGCATLSPEAQHAAVVADPITLSQVQIVVHQYVTRTFKDPYSVRDLEIDEPRMVNPLARGPEWIIPFRCNAKNSFGAYTGLQQHYVYVKHGVIDWGASGMAESVALGEL